ncbi:MAG: protein-disulfide reductase DsbD family protein [Myxococcota bacterium]|jgi:thiol:disulfide interchange protein DsbD
MWRWLRAGGVAWVGAFGIASAAAASGAWVGGADDAGNARVEARIVVHPSARDGERIRAAVQFRLDPGWHLYWKNPGDSGIATEVVWRDADASALAWPAPRAFEEAEGELVTFGYADELLLSSWLQPALGAQQLGADVSLLVCRASCIPAELALSAPLAVDAAERAELVAAFAAHDAALPVAPAAFGASVSAQRSADAREATLVVAPCAGDAACSELALPDAGPAFFAEPDDAGLVQQVDARLERGELVVTFRSDRAALGSRARGVVQLRGADGALHALAIDAALGGGAAPAAASALAHAQGAASSAQPGASGGSLLAMLALALLGGLVLNLMPCVLPVLALKVFAVGELAGHSRREALHHGVAYAAGIGASMLALAGAALALRGAGHAVGWGFQFQEPVYVAAISAVLTGFALNLFGVFEIGFQPSALAEVGANAPGARRSFFEGLLAVALATPCSAPFLGTAIGFAFASPAWVICAVFLSIGAGLALPFVAISAFPRLGRFLPRSGAWMGTLRSGLGFALLATVVWLLWIVGRSAGSDSVAGLLALLLAGSFVAWGYGRLQHAGARFAGIGAGLAVALLVISGVNFVRVSGAARPRAEASHEIGPSEAWSPLGVEQALAAGKPVFAYFTADWCLTCKLNERIALDTDEARALLREGGFTVLRGDWTQRDEAIRRELARHGKAGVPLYLVYSPSAPNDPQLLPELLTPTILANALRRAAR